MTKELEGRRRKLHEIAMGPMRQLWADLHDVETIEIQIRDDKLWVNVDGKCALRVYRFTRAITDNETINHFDIAD